MYKIGIRIFSPIRDSRNLPGGILKPYRLGVSKIVFEILSSKTIITRSCQGIAQISPRRVVAEARMFIT